MSYSTRLGLKKEGQAINNAYRAKLASIIYIDHILLFAKTGCGSGLHILPNADGENRITKLEE
jgi:hypothetical protein